MRHVYSFRARPKIHRGKRYKRRIDFPLRYGGAQSCRLMLIGRRRRNCPKLSRLFAGHRCATRIWLTVTITDTERRGRKP